MLQRLRPGVENGWYGMGYGVWGMAFSGFRGACLSEEKMGESCVLPLPGARYQLTRTI